MFQTVPNAMKYFKLISESGDVNAMVVEFWAGVSMVKGYIGMR
jgi:hypothetical protein